MTNESEKVLNIWHVHMEIDNKFKGGLICRIQDDYVIRMYDV